MANGADTKLKKARKKVDKVKALQKSRESRKKDKEENARLKAAALVTINKGVNVATTAIKKVADPIIKNLTDDARNQVNQASAYIDKRRTSSRIKDAAAASKVKTANRELLMGKVDKTTFDQSLGTGKVKPGYTGGVASSAKARAELAKTVVKGAKRVKTGVQQVAERITGMKVETKPLPVGALGTGKVKVGDTSGRAEFDKGVAATAKAAKFYGSRVVTGGKDILKRVTGQEGGVWGDVIKSKLTDLERKYGEKPTGDRFPGAVPKVPNKNEGLADYANRFLTSFKKSARRSLTPKTDPAISDSPKTKPKKLPTGTPLSKKKDSPTGEDNFVSSSKAAIESGRGGKGDRPRLSTAPRSAFPRPSTKAVGSGKRVLSSFGKAFAAAHLAQGPGGVFDYEGDEKHKKGKYTTDRLDKRDMSKKRRAAQK